LDVSRCNDGTLDDLCDPNFGTGGRKNGDDFEFGAISSSSSSSGIEVIVTGDAER
jgi:hypothetical protein